ARPVWPGGAADELGAQQGRLAGTGHDRPVAPGAWTAEQQGAVKGGAALVRAQRRAGGGAPRRERLDPADRHGGGSQRGSTQQGPTAQLHCRPPRGVAGSQRPNASGTRLVLSPACRGLWITAEPVDTGGNLSYRPRTVVVVRTR